MQGKVSVDGKVVTKAGALIDESALITCDIKEPKYVSRAGFKLEKALEHFGVDVSGLTVLDAGISTGGFTDCLLQLGAAKVYGIDVGYGQVHEKIVNNLRVVVMERTNLRDVESLPEKVDLATLDVSFISLLKVLPAVSNLLKHHAKLIMLIKPQFEAGKEQVGKGGIVKDSKVHQLVIDNVLRGVQALGFTCTSVIESPILGTMGNKEFLAYCWR